MNLQVPYTTWKQVIILNGFQPYHIDIEYGVCMVWCGTSSVRYKAFIDVDCFTDWQQNFQSTSEQVASDDDAIAHIIGIDNPQPTTPIRIQGTPVENDGRLNVVIAPMTQGMYAWWTGAGDDLNPTPPFSGRGTGEDLTFIFEGPGDITKTLDFNSYIELYDAEGVWRPISAWGAGDKFWVWCHIQPNADICTVNEENTGNCHVVNTGQGYSIIVPAAGNGGYDIDLDKARPLPTGPTPISFWNIQSYQQETPPVPSVDGEGNPTGSYALLYDLGYNIMFCNAMPMVSPIGRFEVDSDKSEPLHKNWQIKMRCKKVSEGAGTFAAWLKFFRPSTSEPDFG